MNVLSRCGAVSRPIPVRVPLGLIEIFGDCTEETAARLNDIPPLPLEEPVTVLLFTNRLEGFFMISHSLLFTPYPDNYCTLHSPRSASTFRQGFVTFITALSFYIFQPPRQSPESSKPIIVETFLITSRD